MEAMLIGLLIIIANETKKLNKLQKIFAVCLLWFVLLLVVGRIY